MTTSLNGGRLAPRQPLPVDVRSAREPDLLTIADWVLSGEELRMISGDIAPRLTPDMLRCWIRDSAEALVLTCQSQPVAFCTLSEREYALPDSYVEACHLVVDPRHRRRYFGTAILANARLVAAQHSFLRLVGRVVKGNDGAVRFTHYARWNILDSAHFDPGFHWYYYDLRR